MPQKKKQFRFKIPWISRAPAPPSATESQPRGPKQRSKSERPPFRPPGIAPAPAPPHSPPTQSQGTSRAEPQQHPPSRPPHSPASSVIVESPVSSPPESPSRPSTPTHVNSPISSPSRTPQTQDFLLQFPSPSHAGSPSHLPSGRSMEVSPQPAAEESTHPAPSASEEQENENMKSPLNAITKSPECETSSPPERMSMQPTGSPVSRTQVPSQPQHSSSETNMMPPLKAIPKELELETQSKTHQPDEAKEAVVMEHEPTKLGKGNGIKYGESNRRSKPELHTTAPAASGMQTKDASTRLFRADHRKQKEARESVERKMMSATSSSNTGKDIKVVTSADPAIRNVSSTSISPEKSNEEKQHIPLQKGIKDDVSNLVQKLATVTPTQPMDDKNFSVVTLAGENKGATMHVGSKSTKTEGSIRIHRAYKTDPEEESTELNTDAEEASSRSPTEKDEVAKTYVNSNIQSVNNSLMLHGSVSERDPGVRVVLPQEPAAEPIKHLETRRVEVNVNRVERLSYPRPVVRRRCLRGLFMEPSDSDPDNPDKPRRHGCKVRCGDEGTEIM